jgi:hypothetical protein
MLANENQHYFEVTLFFLIVLLHLHCTGKPPGDLVKMQALVQQSVVGPGVCIFNELLCDADVAVLL